MTQFMVLIEKSYVIGHYVPVTAETPAEAHRIVTGALKNTDEDSESDLVEQVGKRLDEVESDIDEVLEQQVGYRFILNGSSDSTKGLRVASQEDWGRPLVIELKEEETAISAA
jgi:hypothetical protein